MKQLSVGIDIGGTNSVFGLVDREGNMYGEGVVPTQKYPDFDQYLEELYLGIQDLLKKIDFEYVLMGIGIGAPNANYYKGTIENAANLVWKGTVEFVTKFKKYYPNIPIAITNDANAAAIGEGVYGAAKGMKDYIVITLGTGLGSGFVANGEMIYGDDSFAGEFGHICVDKEGHRECGCGRRGCLETFVSATGIKRTIFELLATENCPSVFRSMSFNEVTAEMVSKAANEGDPIAIKAYQMTGDILGRALADAVAITSPKAIILFGGLAKAGKLIFEPTYKSMEDHMLRNYKGKVQLLPSGIDGKNAAVLGSSALIWQMIDK